MLNKKAFFASIILGTIIWNLPHSNDISIPAWHLFAIFTSTIFAIISKAMPIGGICFTSLSIAILSKTLTTHEGFSGFGNPVIWLIVLAFFIARSFIKTGLGNRIAFLFIYFMGKNSLSLAYGLLAGDLILSPAIPSTTARSGGIIFPIVKSLSEVFKSSPETKTEHKIGSFLMLSSFHGNVITSGMFLTAMAANPLIVHFAQLNNITISWTSWALAASVPGIISLILCPLIIKMFCPPEIKETPDSQKFASKELKKLGPLSKQEKGLLSVFTFLLIGWIFPSALGGASATTVALIGLSLLLLLNILTWEDIKAEKGAWDTLVWFSILVTFATFLDKLGFSAYLGTIMTSAAQGLSWQVGSLFLLLFYFLSHYFFASSTAQVSALYGTFLILGIQLGAPALPFALMLGFVSNIYGGLTHYSFGHAPIYFGANFVDIKLWWKLGIIVSSINLFIWLSVGSLWMKFIGFY